MKILHIYKDFFPPVAGGIERHIALMCRYQRAWADVEALTCSRSPRTRRVEREGTAVTEVGEWGRFMSAPVSPTFPWHMRRIRADVAVVHTPNPAAELGWLLARPKARLVVRYHSDVVRQARAMKLYRPFLMHFLRKADMILATSEQYLRVSSILGSVKDRCRVIPLGIAAEDFQNPHPPQVAALRARYGGGYVLFCGRHRYYKGLEHLVRAAEAIRAPVVIAGDGPERAQCMALAEELGVDVAFPGALNHEELVNHLHGCHIFVFPSVAPSEAFGLSILEAHACGKPVVATRLGTGVEFANLHGQTGLNVAPADPGALAEAVNTLLDDSGLRERLGAFARNRVQSELHVSRIARLEFEAYQEVLG